MLDDDGSIGHAEVRIGDLIVLLFDAKESWPDTSAMLRLLVVSIDSVFARSLAAGATAVTNSWTAAWGDRVARVCDPLGNIWWLMEHIEDVDLDEMRRRLAQPEYVDAMRYAQVSFDREVLHADSGKGREQLVAVTVIGWSMVASEALTVEMSLTHVGNVCRRIRRPMANCAQARNEYEA